MSYHEPGLPEVLKALQELKDEVFELRMCLTGDPLKHVQGLVGVVEEHRRELYGDEETQKVGLKEENSSLRERVQKLEDARNAAIAWAAGAGAVSALAWSFLKPLLFK